MTTKLQRIITDLAGYILILAGFLLSPIPGPGGLPLILAGLGILSVNNLWARRFRDHLLEHGGKLAQFLFPPRRSVQILYDIVVVLILMLVAVLAWRHAAVWQIGAATGLFFLALLIGGLNRDRAARLGQKISKT